MINYGSPRTYIGTEFIVGIKALFVNIGYLSEHRIPKLPCEYRIPKTISSKLWTEKACLIIAV